MTGEPLVKKLKVERSHIPSCQFLTCEGSIRQYSLPRVRLHPFFIQTLCCLRAARCAVGRMVTAQGGNFDQGYLCDACESDDDYRCSGTASQRAVQRYPVLQKRTRNGPLPSRNHSHHCNTVDLGAAQQAGGTPGAHPSGCAP